jgi:O-antigen/teichoic acid export membrane protein
MSFYEFKGWLSKNFLNVFKQSISFAILGILTVLLSSLDRLILSANVSKEQLGNYQLADNIAMVFTLGIGAINYLGSYHILSNLSSRKLEVKKFMYWGYTISFLAGILLLILIVPSTNILTFFFPDYSYLKYILPLIFVSRYLDLVFTIPCLVWISKSTQNTYTKYLALLAILIFACLNIISEIGLTNDNLLIYFPSLQIFLKFSFLILMYFQIYKSETDIIN